MAKIYSIDGKSAGTVKLPKVFETEYRPDMIQKAVVSIQSKKRQKYGRSPTAGIMTSAEYFGNRHHTYRMTINKGQSRLPREKPGGGGLGGVRRVPQAVGGRAAHPPRGTEWSKKINNKEYIKALESAIAATSNKDLILSRGHITAGSEFPIVVDDKFESLKKTKDVANAMVSLGLEKDIERAASKKVRAGRGKMRGRKYKEKKSALIVVGEDKGIIKGARNLPGVDVVALDKLNVELLAPGANAGRLTVWTKSAIEKLDDQKWTQPAGS